jgi:hypothetical protein
MKSHIKRNSIESVDAATGEKKTLEVNATLAMGQPFRLIGRDMKFVVTRVHQHPVAGATVSGRTPDGRYGTSARVCDTLAIPVTEVPLDHMTGITIAKLMRQHAKTIRGLAQAMCITQKRVRQVRSHGVQGTAFVQDWMEAITNETKGTRKGVNFDKP